jgi:D-beta-D-heptose 7-phosphate kinase/D-beta-D-heptose 1-phosphate adenosyltransferase
LGEVLSWEEADLKRRRFPGKVVFTNGVFDILHRGHVDYLLAARKLGDMLIVGVNSDASAKRLDKGPDRPLNNQEDRAFLLSQLIPVDVVVIFEQPTPAELIEKLQPDILVKGADYSLNNVVGKDVVEKSGGKVVLIPLTPGKSSTSIINKMQKP